MFQGQGFTQKELLEKINSLIVDMQQQNTSLSLEKFRHLSTLLNEIIQQYGEQEIRGELDSMRNFISHVRALEHKQYDNLQFITDLYTIQNTINNIKKKCMEYTPENSLVKEQFVSCLDNYEVLCQNMTLRLIKDPDDDCRGDDTYTP